MNNILLFLSSGPGGQALSLDKDATGAMAHRVPGGRNGNSLFDKPQLGPGHRRYEQPEPPPAFPCSLNSVALLPTGNW